MKKRVEVFRGVIVEADGGCFRVLRLRKSMVHPDDCNYNDISSEKENSSIIPSICCCIRAVTNSVPIRSIPGLTVWNNWLYQARLMAILRYPMIKIKHIN